MRPCCIHQSRLHDHLVCSIAWVGRDLETCARPRETGRIYAQLGAKT
jgi:hypothetical protein